MLMPIIVELTYEDDTKETFKYPAKFGEKNNDTAKESMLQKKRLKDSCRSKLETADIDVTNNAWPKEVKSKFD
jgi:hypothetical protein